MSRLIRNSLLALVLVMFSTSATLAYVTIKHHNGADTTWGTNNIPWYLNTNGSADLPFQDVQSALTAAFQTWASVPCTTQSFSYQGTSNNPANGIIYIYFNDDTWDPSVGDAAAYTVSDKKWSGQIKGSIIVFNGVDITWTTTPSASQYGYKSDIQGVATHEIGHALGLDHPWIRAATMFFSGGTAELRTLDADDAKGACYLYPLAQFQSGAACDACTENSHCATGACLYYPWENTEFCGANCSSDADCDGPFKCVNVDGVGGQCAPLYDFCSPAGGNIPIGGYCWGPAMCASQMCIPLDNDAYCSTSCNPSSPSSCPTGFTCVGAGTNGYCLKEGSKSLGEECSVSLECETLLCQYGLCSVGCDGPGTCPADYVCSAGACMPEGPTFFGGGCTSHFDCSTGYCTGFPSGYCSSLCGSDNDCPGASICLTIGHCSDVDISGDGGGCASNSDCAPGLNCIMNYSASFGTCRELCDPIADSGCSTGKVCLWYYEPSTQNIAGGCVDDTGGPGEGMVCGVDSGVCQPHLICANLTGGAEGVCVRDCRVSDSDGCDPNGECFPLSDPSDPEHGACIPGDDPNPPPAPDAGPQPQADAGASPDLSEPTGDSGVSNPRSDEGAVPPIPGSTTNTESSGGCTANAEGGGGMVVWITLFFMMLWRREHARVGQR